MRDGAVLAASGITKTYAAPGGSVVRVLDGFDLTVAAGELVAVAGASGSGKTTLLNVLGLLEDPERGEVWYDGTRVTPGSRRGQSRARGRHVGFVFQSFLLLSSLTALDNVLLAARYVGGAGPAARRRALALLERVGMLDRRDHYPPQLSGGEQQRVAFCRAVLNDPPLLLADEPTGNLDDANGAIVVRELRERTQAGHAVLVVTHRPEAFEADRVLHLAGGTAAKEERR